MTDNTLINNNGLTNGGFMVINGKFDKLDLSFNNITGNNAKYYGGFMYFN